MTAPDRRNAIIIAVITAIALIFGAALNSGMFKKELPVVRTAEPQGGHRAETKGDQSPAVVGGKDVAITYGDPKDKGTKNPGEKKLTPLPVK